MLFEKFAGLGVFELLDACGELLAANVSASICSSPYRSKTDCHSAMVALAGTIHQSDVPARVALLDQASNAVALRSLASVRPRPCPPHSTPAKWTNFIVGRGSTMIARMNEHSVLIKIKTGQAWTLNKLGSPAFCT